MSRGSARGKELPVSKNRLQLERPLVAFDLETTGLDPRNDRIVEICCVKLEPGGQRTTRTRRLNPTIPISAEASAVHGIYQRDIAHQPTFTHIAKSLQQFLRGCDLTGFNLTHFDYPMLRAEFQRADMEFPDAADEVRVVDSRRIYVAQEPRNLASALQLYCGRQLENAHSAEADALAAVDILLAQVDRYEDIPCDITGLDEFCHPGRADWIDSEGRLVRQNGEVALGFGKFRGRLLKEVIREDREYVEWIARADFAQEVRDTVSQALADGGEVTGPSPRPEP